VDRSPVFVVTGQLAAGKSTLARSVLDRFPFGLHVDTDAIREMVTSGLAGPLEWTDETTRQFDLAIAGSVALSATYHAAGFAVAIEGAIDPAIVQRRLAEAGLADVLVGVVLHPSADVARRRNRERTNKPFDPSILDEVIVQLDADLARDELPAGWTRIDNGREDVDATVDRLLAIVRERGLGPAPEPPA
jgi:predicted kinase